MGAVAFPCTPARGGGGASIRAPCWQWGKRGGPTIALQCCILCLGPISNALVIAEAVETGAQDQSNARANGGPGLLLTTQHHLWGSQPPPPLEVIGPSRLEERLLVRRGHRPPHPPFGGGGSFVQHTSKHDIGCWEIKLSHDEVFDFDPSAPLPPPDLGTTL